MRRLIPSARIFGRNQGSFLSFLTLDFHSEISAQISFARMLHFRISNLSPISGRSQSNTANGRSWFIGYSLISRGQSPALTLFKDVTTKSAYQARQMPFPIVVTNQRASGDLYNAQDPNVPIVEVTPLEFGDWQSSRGFIRTDMYVGIQIFF